MVDDTTLTSASKELNLTSLPQGTRSHYEKLLQECHWTIAHNQCKGARTNESRIQLLTCTLCCFADSTFTYDHVFRLCPHPLLVRGRPATDVVLAQYSLVLDLEQRLILRVMELVSSSSDGHQICLGNWSSTQFKHLYTALLPSDFSAGIDAVMTTFSRQLVPWINGIWEMGIQHTSQPTSNTGELSAFYHAIQ